MLFSPPPEELKLKMPDMSALNIGESSHHNSMLNDSINFNLDDFLGIKKQDSSTAHHRMSIPNTISNNPINNIVSNFETPSSQEQKSLSNLKTSTQNLPQASNSNILKQRHFRIKSSDLSENPLSLISVIQKYLDDRGAIEAEDLDPFIQNLIKLMDKAESVLSFGRLSASLKEKQKLMEDRKLRIVNLGRVTR